MLPHSALAGCGPRVRSQDQHPIVTMLSEQALGQPLRTSSAGQGVIGLVASSRTMPAKQGSADKAMKQSLNSRLCCTCMSHMPPRGCHICMGQQQHTRDARAKGLGGGLDGLISVHARRRQDHGRRPVNRSRHNVRRRSCAHVQPQCVRFLNSWAAALPSCITVETLYHRILTTLTTLLEHGKTSVAVQGVSPLLCKSCTSSISVHEGHNRSLDAQPPAAVLVMHDIPVPPNELPACLEQGLDLVRARIARAVVDTEARLQEGFAEHLAHIAGPDDSDFSAICAESCDRSP